MWNTASSLLTSHGVDSKKLLGLVKREYLLIIDYCSISKGIGIFGMGILGDGVNYRNNYITE